MEMVKEIPGYKIILKAILKDQIQLLVEQLALHAQEESIILTASVSDGSISHLGSRLGRQFLERHGDIKSQFLGFCLRSSHQALQQQHLQQREAYVYHNSTLSQPSQVEDIHPTRHSPKIRHEPYSTKRPSKRSPDKIQNTTCESSPEIILAFSEHDNVTNVKSENYGFENPGLIEIKSREQVEIEKRDQLDTESRGHDEIESRGQLDTKGRGQLDNDTEGRGQVDNEPRGQIEIKGREQVDTESMSKVESMSDIQLEHSMKPHIKCETEEHLRMKGDYSINEPVFRLGLQDATSREVIEVTDDSSREQVSPDCHDTSGFSTDSEVLVKIETDEEAWSEPGNSAFSPFGNLGMAAQGKHGQNLELVSGQVVGEGQGPVRVHICDLCGKPFPSKWELGRHRRTHTGERPYHCHYCEKSFSDKSNMNQHIRGVHLRQPFRRDRTYRGERLQDKFDERDPY